MPTPRNAFGVAAACCFFCAMAAASGKAEKRPAEPPRGAPRVIVAPFAGVISPVAAEFMTSAIAKAEEEHAAAVVLELDTPGGLDPSMRIIVQAVMGSKVPVVVYVYPPGGRAASAGVFITMAAHVAAMAPGTNIGAAHPVTLPSMVGDRKQENKEDPVMAGKLANDAAAYLRSIARERGRNEAWAAEAVMHSASIPMTEAVNTKVVDLAAPSLAALLTAIDGRKIPGLTEKLRTAGADIEAFGMTRRQRWLATLSDPNVAMILMSLGAAGLFIELYSPGLILPGIAGAVCLVLAFYSFQTLSASYAGVVLIVLGMLFFLLEVKVAAYGMLSLGGAASLLLGMLMLFRPGPMGGIGISWAIAGSTLASMLGLTAFASVLVFQSRRNRPTTGLEGMVGSRGRAMTALVPGGKVTLRGEVWDAVSAEGTLPEGTTVVVRSVDGLVLKVGRHA